MSLPRFYIPPEQWNPASVVLPKEETKHCIGPLRRRENDYFIVFNGCGEQLTCRIAAITGSKITSEVIEQKSSPQKVPRFILAPAILKGKNMDWVIQKATELGVSEIQPLLTDHTIARINEKEAHQKQQKWQRVALEACKQCGQDWLPIISQPLSISSFFATEKNALKLIAALTPESIPLKEALRKKNNPSEIVLAIGPEGDFSSKELAAAPSAGFTPVSMGPLVLRAETASLYGLAALCHELK